MAIKSNSVNLVANSRLGIVNYNPRKIRREYGATRSLRTLWVPEEDTRILLGADDLRPYDRGKEAPSKKLLHGSSPALSVALPISCVHDMHSTRCEYDRQDSRSYVRCGRSPSRHNTGDLCYDHHGHRPRRHGCGDRNSERWHDHPDSHRRRQALVPNAKFVRLPC